MYQSWSMNQTRFLWRATMVSLELLLIAVNFREYLLLNSYNWYELNYCFVWTFLKNTNDFILSFGTGEF
jgi:hypothetical protein